MSDWERSISLNDPLGATVAPRRTVGLRALLSDSSGEIRRTRAARVGNVTRASTSEEVPTVMNHRTITVAVASLVLGSAAPAMAQEAAPHVATHHGAAAGHPSHASPAPPASSAPSEAPAASPEPAASAAPANPEPTAPATDTTSAPVEATPPPEPTPVVPVAPPAPPPLVLRGEPRPERWVATVIAVGSLATTIAFGVIALNDQSAYNASPTQDRADATARDGMVADIFLGLTVVSAIATVVLFVAPNADGPHSVATNSGAHHEATVRMNANGFAVTF